MVTKTLIAVGIGGALGVSPLRNSLLGDIIVAISGG